MAGPRLLGRLFAGLPLSRFDAAQIDDHLGAGVRPQRGGLRGNQ
jgi:hypothetical protein